MKHDFYPVISRNRCGRYDVTATHTKRAALTRMAALKQSEHIVKVGVLEKGAYRYTEIIDGLKSINW